MKQQQIGCEHEAFPAELSWIEMMELNIQVDYDAIVFPLEDDSDFIESVDSSSIELEDQSAEIQGESSPSSDLEIPRSLEVKQETTPSPDFKITPLVEETNQHVRDLTKQVDDLKTELQSTIFDLHKERDRRISYQAEVKSQQEEIQKLQKLLEKERHLQAKREQVTCSSKVTTDKTVLRQLEHFKWEAEKYASRNKGLIEVMVEEYRVRLKYEEQLKSLSEQASKFKEQEETVKSLQGQVADLKEKLKLALDNNHQRVCTQPEVPLQTEGSIPTKETKQRQTLNQQGRRPRKDRPSTNQGGPRKDRPSINQGGPRKDGPQINQGGQRKDRPSINQGGPRKDGPPINQGGPKKDGPPINQGGPRKDKHPCDQTPLVAWRAFMLALA
ncbi:PREDICTED: translation initiation factor IF-2-like isoform X2 [Poecilia mexicana]|uniref:translation initiation factor IF-2-like isoform X2 n=1 Tax=Poecilia mexicana TaxID=48701 RepID=UPI00072D9D3B|nr:PREDICTED: translation initiation factor IF-2-like isoform X2 [Poecilia mexicana]